MKGTVVCWNTKALKNSCNLVWCVNYFIIITAQVHSFCDYNRPVCYPYSFTDGFVSILEGAQNCYNRIKQRLCIV